jgi:glycosyltransferase involved in cell wall biosynthesis
VRYLLADIDLTEELPDIALSPDDAGVGIVVRRQRRPIGFVLQGVSPGAALTSAEIARLLAGVTNGTGAPKPEASGGSARTPSVTAVVCTRDRPELLARCLASLHALAATPAAARIDFEILVVDNAPSDDRTREVVARVPNTRYVRAPVQGLDIARNCGLREARGEFVAFFDDDVTADGGWLEGFAEALAAHPDAAAVTGPVLPYELATRAQILFEEWGGFGHRFQKLRHDAERTDDPLFPCSPGRIGAGCNMAVRRAVVQALGGFDEALDTGTKLPGGGDMDVFYRLLRAGHAIATEPQCLVFHQHRRSYHELRYQMWTWGLGFMAFVGKSYRTDPEQRGKFRRLILQWYWRRALHVALCVTGHAKRPLGLALAQFAGGLVGLFGEYSRSQRRIRLRRLVADQALRLASRQETT